MADNVALPLSGTGQSTANIATDDVGGVQYQRVKVSFGVDGSATDASAVDPLPVVYAGGLYAGANNIGHVTVDNFPAVGDEDSAKPGDLLVVGGTDGVNAKTLKLDANNSLLVTTVGTQTITGAVTVSSLPSGANNIGDVDVLTLPGLAESSNNIGDVDVLSLPGLTSGSNAIGSVVVSGIHTGANTIGAVVVNSITAGLPSGANTIGSVASIVAGLPTGANTIGAVTAAGNFPVTDAGGSLTVDNSTLSEVGGGTEAAALRVTIASDSTGVLSVDDNGGSLTVDGSVAVTGLPTGANTIGAIASIVAGLPTGANTIGAVTADGNFPVTDAGGSLTVDNPVLSVVGPGLEATAQRVTIASDSTGVLSVDDNGGSLTVDGPLTDAELRATPVPVSGTLTVDAGVNVNTAPLALEAGGNLAGAATSLAVIDDWDESDRAKVNPIVGQAGVAAGSGTVSATTQRVVLATDVALPAGTNNIGDVDVLTLPGLSSGSNTIGNVVVNSITAGLPTGANTIGAVASIVAGLPTGANTIGAVVVNSITAGLPTGANTIGAVTVSGTVAVTDNAGSLTVDNPTLSVVGGGVEATALRVTLASDSTGLVSVDDNGGSLTVDGSVAVTGLPAGANTIGGVNVVAGLPTGANTIGSVGVTAITAGLPTGANTIGAVASIVAGLPTGANTIGAVASIVAGLPTGANTIGAVTVSGNTSVNGSVAHDAVDAGNPLKIGAKAVAHGSNPTAVAAADRTDLYANRHGVLFTIGGHPNIQTLRVPITAAQTDVALVTVAGGTKLVVTRVSAVVAYSTSVDTVVRIGFGAATTPTGAGVILSHPGIAAGSGVVEGNGSGILGIGADGEDLRITSSVPTSGSLEVLISYFTIES